MNTNSQEIDYDRWEHVIINAQLLIATSVFIIEIVNNILLYITRSQGYGPDTIVEKLIRYLLVTTIINYGLIIISKLIVKKYDDNETKKFALMVCTTLMCTDVALSHYQFSATLVIFVLPLLISILYEDLSLTNATLLLSLIGQTFAIMARGFNKEYNKDIGPEAIIAYGFSVGVYLISRLIQKTLVSRRNELGSALIEVEKANASAERAKLSLKMLETMAKAIDAKDKYTNGHSLRVAAYSILLAEALGFSAEQIESLKYEALLHDVGKIGVPDSVLNKPDRLTDSEFNIIKSHTLVGADILKDMIAVPGAYEVAKFHHERYDGKGYPNHISGEDIPLNARIVCIADSYDAMSSDRIYRKALSHDVIREELIKGRGTQFDPEILDVFLALFDEYKLKVSVGAVSLDEETVEQEYILEDIRRVIRTVSEMGDNNASFNDFDKFYKYMRNIGIRYNRSIEVLSVLVVPKTDDISEDMQEMVSKDLESAIRKNIRSVDVHYKHTDYMHMIILMDAGIDNIGIIIQRITYDFNYGDNFELSFEVNENIKSVNDIKNVEGVK